MKRHRRLVLTGLACVLGLTFVGCAAENDDAAGVGSLGTGSENSSNQAEPKEGAAEAQKLAPEDCLKGAWVADNAFFLAGLREFGNEPQSVTGDVVITYGADGKLTTDYQDWLITFNVDGVTTLISRIGVDTGNFTATADTVSINDTQMGSEMLVTVSGMAMPVEPDPISYTDASYTCSATEASITTSDGEMRMTRR